MLSCHIGMFPNWINADRCSGKKENKIKFLKKKKKKRNKYEALKLNLLKQQQEQDMVHQRELQRKERFSGELQRQEELPEVEERMRELLCHQHESFLKLPH